MERCGLVVSSVFSVLLCAAQPGAGAGQDGPETGDATRSVEALPATGTVVVDGMLDEEVWTGEAASGFSQREPATGKPATEWSNVWIAFTPRVLYIALLAHDAAPESLIAKEMERDGPLEQDDSFAVLLDTFHDHRNAYYFEVNPNGARRDGLVNEDGRSFLQDWDGIWEVKARKTSEGWTAEIAIPISTLRFDPRAAAWGINFRRIIRRKNETVFWSPIGLDADFLRVSKAGRLTGLRDLQPGVSVQIKPFSVGSSTTLGDGNAEEEIEAGLDLRWSLSRELLLDLTYNTDFAETEADLQQINLTRFSLFFPEKRDFFLENAGIFEFGPDAYLGPSPLRAFFSRRIGLTSGGQPVPIDWGARLTGHVRGWSLGLLGVETDGLRGEAEPTLRTRWSVMRVKRNVGKRSAVGMLITDREQGDGDSNRVLGLDAELYPHPKLDVRLFGALSRDPGVAGDNRAAGAAASWRGTYWSWDLDVLEIEPNFNPEAGFLLRQGVRRYSPNLSWSPRPAWPGVRNLDFQAVAEVYTDLDGRVETSKAELHFAGVELESGDSASLVAQLNTERIDSPFAIRPDIVIPPGEYGFDRFALLFATNPARVVAVDGGTSLGEFYDGERIGATLNLLLRPSRFLRTSTGWSFNDVDLPAGRFKASILRQGISVSLNPDLSAHALMQYNTLERLATLNLRLGWIYRPGADFLVVYNHVWGAPRSGSLISGDHQGIVKLTTLLAF